MSDQPQPADADAPVQTTTVTVRRAPRYYRFMMVGLGVGLIVTVILVLSFPTQSDYSALQVIGFVGLFIVAICVALGALVAIALDRSSRKRARTVEAQRTEEHDPTASEAE